MEAKGEDGKALILATKYGVAELNSRRQGRTRYDQQVHCPTRSNLSIAKIQHYRQGFDNAKAQI
jgi:hypothetical protein